MRTGLALQASCTLSYKQERVAVSSSKRMLRAQPTRPVELTKPFALSHMCGNGYYSASRMFVFYLKLTYARARRAHPLLNARNRDATSRVTWTRYYKCRLRGNRTRLSTLSCTTNLLAHINRFAWHRKVIIVFSQFSAHGKVGWCTARRIGFSLTRAD